MPSVALQHLPRKGRWVAENYLDRGSTQAARKHARLLQFVAWVSLQHVFVKTCMASAQVLLLLYRFHPEAARDIVKAVRENNVDNPPAWVISAAQRIFRQPLDLIA